MSEAETAAPRRRSGILWIVLAVLVVAYFGVTSGIRAYVSSQIERSKDQPLPPFTLKDLNGRRWGPEDFRGKTTVLNFFRSRCPNCLRERDAIFQLAKEADPDRLQVVGVMTDRVVSGISEDLTKRTLKRMAFEHPILMADEAFVDAFHGAGWAHVTPVTYVVDAKGKITHTLRGHQELETLRSATRRP